MSGGTKELRGGPVEAHYRGYVHGRTDGFLAGKFAGRTQTVVAVREALRRAGLLTSRIDAVPCGMDEAPPGAREAAVMRCPGCGRDVSDPVRRGRERVLRKLRERGVREALEQFLSVETIDARTTLLREIVDGCPHLQRGILPKTGRDSIPDCCKTGVAEILVADGEIAAELDSKWKDMLRVRMRRFARHALSGGLTVPELHTLMDEAAISSVQEG